MLYDDLLAFYKRIKDPLRDLEFERTGMKHGQQGVVGVMSPRDDTVGGKYIFKLSLENNYLIYHEYLTMKALHAVVSFCPYFVRAYGIIKVNVEPKFNQRGTHNPFHISSKYPVRTDVLLMEKIDNSKKFFNYIRTPHITETQLVGVCCQVLMALQIAQTHARFTHYDLHTDNVIVRCCDPSLCVLYVLNDQHQFLVPTYGIMPCIIDYGFSYTHLTNQNPMYCTLFYTDQGYTSDRFDHIADTKHFLLSVSDDIRRTRPRNRTARKFRSVVRNLFSPLRVDKKNGWDVITKISALEFVLKMLVDVDCGDSRIFNKCPEDGLGLIQSLIVLPLEHNNYDNLEKSYGAFISEWTKIECAIGNVQYAFYVLKELIDAARDQRHLYMDASTRKVAVRNVRSYLFSVIDSIAEHCSVENLSVDKMLCSLFVFTRCMEGVLYEAMETYMDEKMKDYESLTYNQVEQIAAVIMKKIELSAEFSEGQTITIINSISRRSFNHSLTAAQARVLNERPAVERGAALFGML